MNQPVFPTRKYEAVFVSNHETKKAEFEARNAKLVEAMVKAHDPLAIIKMIITKKEA